MSFTDDYLKRRKLRQSNPLLQGAPRFTLPTTAAGVVQKSSAYSPAPQKSGKAAAGAIADKVQSVQASVPVHDRKAARESRYASSTIAGPKPLPSVGRELAFARRARSGADTVKALQKQQDAYLEQRRATRPRNALDDFGWGVGYGSERTAGGLLGAVEKPIDAIGSGFWNAVGTITSFNNQQPNALSDYAFRQADAFLEDDVTGRYKQSVEERYKPTDAHRKLGDLSETVAAMLPSIAAASATGGTSALGTTAPKLAGADLGRTLMGLQAAGGAATEAKKEGASTGAALLYGATSGLLETTIESVAGGIPGLGTGKATELVSKVVSNPVVRRLVDAAGEGGEEALSTIITPYIKRAIYDPEAENATLDEIAQSAVMGMLASGVLQAGVEIPAAISNRVDVTKMANENLSNLEFVERTTQEAVDSINQNLGRRPVMLPMHDNPLGDVLPSVEQVQAQRPSSPHYRRGGVDNPLAASYDVGNQNQTGGADYGRREEAPAAGEGVLGAALQAEASGAEETYRGRVGGVLEEGRRVQQPEAWAQGHIVRTPSAQAQNAASRAKRYSGDVFVVDDTALKTRNPNAWAVTNGGKIYISDAIPAELADAVGYHECVHVLRQQDNEAYHGFLSDESRLLKRSSEMAMDLLDLVADTRFPGKSIMDLTPEEAAIAYDELNALVWGYYKADPENARAQFAGAFLDYDAYIQELDAIMEGARQAARLDRSAGAAPDVYDLLGSGSENLPEIAVGANKSSQWGMFQASRSEFFPEGANAARPVDVPTTDPMGRNIRKTAATAMGAKAIPDEVVGEIQNMVMSGKLSYGKVTDKASIARAVRTIERDGFQPAVARFADSVQKGIISKDLVTLGQQLLVNAANAGDANATAELLGLYAQMETVAGQAVQAASILRKLSPTAQLYAAQKAADNLERALSKQLKGKEIKIDPALIDEFNQQTDQAGRDAVMDKIYTNIAEQTPSTWKDKWNAWRYLAMLGNPRTHIRNFMGNAGFQPVRAAKDRIAAVIEAGVSAVSGGELKRTKSFMADPALYRAAWNDYTNVAEVLNGSKYDDVQSIVEDRRPIFKTKPLETVRKKNTELLGMEDAIFKRITYTDALAGYLNANGVTAEQMKAGTVDPSLLAAARDYAGQEALKATYNDKNVVSNKVVQAAHGLGAFGEAVLPFKRTPANILVRGMEYSPLGLAKGLTYDLYKVKKGEMSGAQAIDDIAAGLTGSGLMALGALLAANGIVTGGAGDDEKQAALDDLTGGQTYALNLPGGKSVTLDWLAPEALPFFMGVQAMQSFGEEGLTADTISGAFSSISEPMLEMSMLQSLNDLIDNVSYAKSNEKLTGLVSSALVSYLTQALPTILGQAERSGEDKRYTTYTDKNMKFLPTNAQYAIGKASARIPIWDFNQIPYIDAWGREEATGTLPMRVRDNFLNPAYTSSLNVTPVDKEIQRLYNATGNGAVVPSRADKSITVDKETINLTGEEYVKYATTRGQTAFNVLEAIVDTDQYQKLTDKEKEKLVTNVYSYANDVGKAAVSSFKPEGDTRKVQSSGVEPSAYFLYKATADRNRDGNVTQGEAAAALLPMRNLTTAEKGKVWQSQNSSWNEKKNPFTGALAAAGIDPQTAVGIVDKYAAVSRTDQKAGEKTAELWQYLDGLDLTEDQRTVVNDTFKFFNQIPATVQAYNIETMSESAREKWPKAKAWGLSEEAYLKYYPLVSSGKKVECLQALQDAGMTAAQANKFWDIVKKK